MPINKKKYYNDDTYYLALLVEKLVNWHQTSNLNKGSVISHLSEAMVKYIDELISVLRLERRSSSNKNVFFQGEPNIPVVKTSPLVFIEELKHAISKIPFTDQKESKLPEVNIMSLVEIKVIMKWLVVNHQKFDASEIKDSENFFLILEDSLEELETLPLQEIFLNLYVQLEIWTRKVGLNLTTDERINHYKFYVSLQRLFHMQSQSCIPHGSVEIKDALEDIHKFLQDLLPKLDKKLYIQKINLTECSRLIELLCDSGELKIEGFNEEFFALLKTYVESKKKIVVVDDPKSEWQSPANDPSFYMEIVTQLEVNSFSLH